MAINGITELAKLFKERENSAGYSPMLGTVIELPNIKIRLGEKVILTSSHIKSCICLDETDEEGNGFTPVCGRPEIPSDWSDKMMVPETKGLTGVSSVNADVNGKSFLFNFATGDFVIQDGKLIECDGMESVKVWIEKILRTEKGRFKIYDNTEYGCRLEDLLIGNNYPISFIESELKREIEEALLRNSQISAVSNFVLERGVNSITVSMAVK